DAPTSWWLLATKSGGDAPDRASGGAERLGAGRVGAARRQGDGGAEGVGAADERADVAGVVDVPELERHGPRLGTGQVLAAVDADHARGVSGGGDLGEQRRLDVLTGDEQLDRLGRGRPHQVFAFDEEEPELVAPPPLVQLAHELPLLVVARGDPATPCR